MIGIVVDVCNFVALTVSDQRVLANRFHAFRITRTEQRAVTKNLNLNSNSNLNLNLNLDLNAQTTSSGAKCVRNRV